MELSVINRRAEKVMNRVNALGFSKNGKPMVIDQAREVIAEEEGCRNWHVLQARLNVSEANRNVTLANRFHEEMMGSYESIVELAEQYGPWTLADLFYLQNAILTESFIDDLGGDSKIVEVLGHLPSRDLWMTYVRLLDEESTVAPHAWIAAEQKDNIKFVNHYVCECGHEWEDEWDCACNDRCPACNKEIEPYISDDGSLPEGAVEAARTRLLEGRLLETLDHSVAEDPSQP